MSRVEFDVLPSSARVWVFAAERPLSAHERTHVLDVVDRFLDQWNAHGAALTSGRTLRYDQFVMVGVDDIRAGPSGCSIDALVRSLKGLERELGMSLTDHSPVLFRADGEVRRVSRDEFARLAERGDVTLDTIVFDNTVQRLHDVRAGRWECRAAGTWHARALFTEGPPPLGR